MRITKARCRTRRKIKRSSLTALSEGLSVRGNLDLGGTNVTALPDGLSVGGGDDLWGTKITALPDRLSVGGYLDLNRTKITALPEGLKVGGKIFGGPKLPRRSIGAEAARTLRYLVVR